MWIYTKKRIVNASLIESIYIEKQCGTFNVVAVESVSGQDYVLYRNKDVNIAEEMLMRIRYGITTNKNLVDIEREATEIHALIEKGKGKFNDDGRTISYTSTQC